MYSDTHLYMYSTQPIHGTKKDETATENLAQVLLMWLVVFNDYT